MPESVQLAPSRQLLAAIVDSSDDAIISKNLKGIITSWNPAAERIFGYTTAEAVGQPVLMLIPEDRVEEEPQILARISRGERIEHFETVRRRKDGKLLQISATISPIKDDTGTIVGASKIARDITERRETERALAEAQQKLRSYAQELEARVKERTRKLQQSIGELEAFSYSLSHDLRAPLRAIQSFLQIFLEDHAPQVPPEGLDTLQRVIAAAQRMDRMVLDLLAFTQLSHQSVPIEVVDTEKVLTGIISERPEFQKPKALVEIVRPVPNVRGNEASLTQCLTNLLDNAVKFIAPGTTPHVKVSSESRDGEIRLWVEDNGIGISPEDQAQLFRMFHRVHGKEYPGTGIGLAIVRKAVERMGGSAGVESAPGEGSRFWIQLPLSTS